MERYEKKLGPEGKAVITGTKCSTCGFVLLDSDEGIWAALGL
jgi:hypothetical protein